MGDHVGDYVCQQNSLWGEPISQLTSPFSSLLHGLRDQVPVPPPDPRPPPRPDRTGAFRLQAAAMARYASGTCGRRPGFLCSPVTPMRSALWPHRREFLGVGAGTSTCESGNFSGGARRNAAELADRDILSSPSENLEMMHCSERSTIHPKNPDTGSELPAPR